MNFSRRDTSILGRWWWTVDRLVVAALLVLICIGVFLSFAGSPSVADRLGYSGFYLAKRHVLYLIPSILLLLGISLLSPLQIRRLSLVVYILGIIGLIFTTIYGVEIKGAQRWIIIGNLISIQPSEFVKPAFVVITAWMLAERSSNPDFAGFTISLGLLGVYVGLLALQPDLGMIVVAVVTWLGLLFMAGIRLCWLLCAGGGGLAGLFAAYWLLPHVQKRIDQFLNPKGGDPQNDLYQVQQSLEAFANGGLWGKGPGEGVVKKHLPDAHADFIFAVAGEEFGFWLCLVLLSCFLFIILRSFLRITYDQSIFVIIATAGLLIQFGLQVLINVASTLNMIPTKGMTLPFISYGGSSMLALAISMGMVLALTRKRHGYLEAV